MNDKDTIQALKDNEKPFGLMTAEMQEKAKEIGHEHFECYENTKKHEWGPLSQFNEYRFGQEYTYRLRADYSEEPEIVECEVRLNPPGRDYYCYDKGGNFSAQSLCKAVNDPDFIGFLYKDPRMACESKRSALPRLYLNIKERDTYCHIGSNAYDDMEVLTPTHVLFRKDK